MKALLALLLLAFTTTLHAQERQWDIRVAAAGGTQPYLHQGGKFLTLNIFQPEWEESAYTETIMHRLNDKHIQIGLSAVQGVITQYHVPGISLFSNSDDSIYVTRKEKFFTLMPSFQYSFLQKRSIRLYSELSAGVAFTKTNFYDKEERGNAVQGAYQVTFLGFRFGRRIAGFIDLGYGYKGVAQLGISGQF